MISVIDKWPNWLRWVLFFPTAVVAFSIVYPIVLIGNILFSPIENSFLYQFFISVMGYAASGFAFVWFGAIIAPRKQFMVSITMASMYFFTSILLLILKVKLSNIITLSSFEIILIAIAGGGGAVLACWYFKAETGTDHSKNIKKDIIGGASIAFVVTLIIVFLAISLTPSRSKDFESLYSATKASTSLVNLLEIYGANNIATENELAEQRLQATRLAKLAFEKASTISREYLAGSNAESPDEYFEHFVPAMDYFWHGFAKQDTALVQQGVSHYNKFLLWIKSKERSDFKVLR